MARPGKTSALRGTQNQWTRDPEEGGWRHWGHRKIQVDLDLNPSSATDSLDRLS